MIPRRRSNITGRESSPSREMERSIGNKTLSDDEFLVLKGIHSNKRLALSRGTTPENTPPSSPRYSEYEGNYRRQSSDEEDSANEMPINETHLSDLDLILIDQSLVRSERKPLDQLRMEKYGCPNVNLAFYTTSVCKKGVFVCCSGRLGMHTFVYNHQLTQEACAIQESSKIWIDHFKNKASKAVGRTKKSSTDRIIAKVSLAGFERIMMLGATRHAYGFINDQGIEVLIAGFYDTGLTVFLMGKPGRFQLNQIFRMKLIKAVCNRLKVDPDTTWRGVVLSIDKTTKEECKKLIDKSIRMGWDSPNIYKSKPIDIIPTTEPLIIRISISLPRDNKKHHKFSFAKLGPISVSFSYKERTVMFDIEIIGESIGIICNGIFKNNDKEWLYELLRRGPTIKYNLYYVNFESAYTMLEKVGFDPINPTHFYLNYQITNPASRYVYNAQEQEKKCNELALRESSSNTEIQPKTKRMGRVRGNVN